MDVAKHIELATRTVNANFIFMVLLVLEFSHQIVYASPRHRDADDIAPLADSLVGLQVGGVAFAIAHF
jgi:hypothetical protein